MSSSRVILIVVLVGALVSRNSFPGAFHFDDRPLLLENQRVVGDAFSWKSFLTHYGGRPFTLLWFRVAHGLFGASPTAFHLVSLLVHLVASALVVLLAFRWKMEGPAALFSGLLFVGHPLVSQAVNYTWAQSTLLMTCFGLAAIILARTRPVVALLLFQFAIWSRTEALVLAALISLMNRRTGLALVVICSLNLIGFGAGFFVEDPSEFGINYGSPFSFWLGAPALLLSYLKLMVFPVGLTIDHDFVFPGRLTALLLAVVAGAVIGGLVWSSVKEAKLFPPLLLLFLGLMPSLIVPNTDPLTESRAYLPLVGFALAAGILVWSWSQVWRWVSLAAGAALLLLCALTVMRNPVWSDEVRVTAEAARLSPGKARAHYNHGASLARRGDVAAAAHAFRKSLDLNPLDDLSYAALGYCAEIEQDWTQALKHYRRALELNPNSDYAAQGYSRVWPVVADRPDPEKPESDP